MEVQGLKSSRIFPGIDILLLNIPLCLRILVSHDLVFLLEVNNIKIFDNIQQNVI